MGGRTNAAPGNGPGRRPAALGQEGEPEPPAHPLYPAGLAVTGWQPGHKLRAFS
jgi:hypothetical protein